MKKKKKIEKKNLNKLTATYSTLWMMNGANPSTGQSTNTFQGCASDANIDVKYPWLYNQRK